MTTKTLTRLLSVVLVLILSMNVALASGDEHDKEQHAAHHDDHKTEKFSPGDFIIDHVGDSHEWHIATLGHTHLTIPLPIIVKSTQPEGGWSVFMSSKFHHGHELYNGYGLGIEGDHKGKIYEVNEAGEFIGYPLDLSFTKTAAGIVLSISVMLWVFLSMASAYTKRAGQAPKGIQSLLEPLILFIRDEVAKPMIGAKYERYLPFLLTVFFFIFLNNLLGLVPWFPGGANVTGNISVTLVLAILVFLITTFSGKKDYWMHIFWTPGVPWWLKVPIPLMPIVELSGVFVKPFVLMVRLFANILAGHIIALGFYSLIFIFGGMALAAGYGVSIVSIAFTIFMNVLELLVAFIQAFVFTLLAAIYFGAAVEEHHHEEHAH